jgi:hypothetical protein
MLGWIRVKMATSELALGGGKFFAFDSTAIGNNAQFGTARALQVEEPTSARVLQIEEPTTTRALQVGTTQLPLGKVLGTMHIHPTHPTWAKGWTDT